MRYLLGEYITLYQYQRKQIKKRMEEKEAQLQIVSVEREELKEKVGQLQTLITRYMSNNSAIQDLSQSIQENGVASHNGDGS